MKGMLQLLEWPLVSLQDLVCKQLRIMINMLWANLELMISGEHVSTLLTVYLHKHSRDLKKPGCRQHFC